MRSPGLLVLILALLSSAAPPTLAQAPDGPETVVVRNGTLKLRALLWRPRGTGPFPAVLFNHGSGRTIDQSGANALGPVFARHGYVFLYLFRRGTGLSSREGENSAVLMQRAFVERGDEGRNELQLRLLDDELTDVVAGLAALRSRPEVDPRRVAAGGHSFGGSLTVLLAERDEALRAAVIFGGAAASWERSPELRSRLTAAAGRTSVPVFYLYAENDYSVAPGKALDAEMAHHGKSHRVTIYPAIGSTPAEGHDLVHQAIATWEPDVFTFLDAHVKR